VLSSIVMNLGLAVAVASVVVRFRRARGLERQRIQALVDRRFNRRRYDAAQTIAAFSVCLRDEIDLNTLTGELLAVVDTTIQPTEAWLWLRPPRQPSGTASLPQPDVVIQTGGARRHVGPRPLPPDGRDRHHRRYERTRHRRGCFWQRRMQQMAAYVLVPGAGGGNR